MPRTLHISSRPPPSVVPSTPVCCDPSVHTLCTLSLGGSSRLYSSIAFSSSAFFLSPCAFFLSGSFWAPGSALRSSFAPFPSYDAHNLVAFRALCMAASGTVVASSCGARPISPPGLPYCSANCSAYCSSGVALLLRVLLRRGGPISPQICPINPPIRAYQRSIYTANSQLGPALLLHRGYPIAPLIAPLIAPPGWAHCSANLPYYSVN